IFDVVLNREHTIVNELDIWSRVKGRAIAHQEVVPFTVKNDQLYVMEEESEVVNRVVTLEFVKGAYDNPKVNAFYLLRGKQDASGPRAPDPYADDDSSMMLPVFIAIGAFIPILFCLCQL
ncbi:unnamed protein product, partial [Cyprideis torosa]